MYDIHSPSDIRICVHNEKINGHLTTHLVPDKTTVGYFNALVNVYGALDFKTCDLKVLAGASLGTVLNNYKPPVYLQAPVDY